MFIYSDFASSQELFNTPWNGTSPNTFFLKRIKIILIFTHRVADADNDYDDLLGFANDHTVALKHFFYFKKKAFFVHLQRV